MHHGKKLGCVVNDDGIKIDPHKVDALARWKTPMNRDLLRGFLSSTGYLADDIDHVRIPMGIQRAFQEIKDRAVVCKNHRCKPLDYSEGAPPITCSWAAA